MAYQGVNATHVLSRRVNRHAFPGSEMYAWLLENEVFKSTLRDIGSR